VLLQMAPPDWPAVFCSKTHCPMTTSAGGVGVAYRSAIEANRRRQFRKKRQIEPIQAGGCRL
jgi:hypothetical protein